MLQLKLFLIAVQFFTRIPITGSLAQWADYSPDRLSASARYFSWVGALAGAVAALMWCVLSQTISPMVSAVLVFAATAWITGAFHEDGLADYVDGIGGGHTRERRLAIMKDSRIGSYGALALIIATLVKVFALIDLPAIHGMVALLFGHTFARWSAVIVMANLAYARDDAGDDVSGNAKSKPLAKNVGRVEVAIGAIPVVAIVLCCAWYLPTIAVPLAISILVACVAAMLIARQMHAKLGGFTGDALGACEQVCEVAILLTFTVMQSPLLPHSLS
jgi:adenosylcobinamide-GDP ribazoletransferase